MKPLTAAYKYRCIDAIKLLLEKGADPQSIVRDVIKDNNLSILKLLVPCVGLSYIDHNTSPSVVEFLLSNGEMVGIDTFKQITDKSHSTNLHLLEVLLKSLDGNTPLHHSGQDDIVKQLLRYNVDPNIPNALGISPMQKALTACNITVIDLLKQYGGKLDEMDIYDEGDDEYENILNHLSEDIYATDNWYRRTLDYTGR